MHWELWDTNSGNMVGDYATETDALMIVRDAVRRHGPAVAATRCDGMGQRLPRRSLSGLSTTLRPDQTTICRPYSVAAT